MKTTHLFFISEGFRGFHMGISTYRFPKFEALAIKINVFRLFLLEKKLSH